MARDEVELFESIKRELRVSFDDFNDEIEELIEEGKSELESKTGPLPFIEESKTTLGNKSRSLLKMYCRYAFNGNRHLFKKDFQSDVLSLQLDTLIEKRKKR